MMAIEFTKKSDVTQQVEQRLCKAKVAGSSPAASTKDSYDNYFESVVEKHEKRLAYNAAYQRDLRTIKRLGLNCTVKEWREKNDSK